MVIMLRFTVCGVGVGEEYSATQTGSLYSNVIEKYSLLFEYSTWGNRCGAGWDGVTESFQEDV